MQTLLYIFLLTFIPQTPFSEPKYFEVLSDGSPEKIEMMLERLQKEQSTSKTRAYIGALLMKKSHLVKKPKEKIAVFKRGRMLLENEITKNPNQPEYRFLRLMIQEHAPKFLKYNTNIKEDKDVIIKNFNTLSHQTKQHILNYAKQSEQLNRAILK